MDPYGAGLARGRPASIKTGLTTDVCVVLDTVRDNRGLELIPPFTRCVRSGDVLELIVTDEREAAPGGRVDRVAGIAFTTASASGVIMVGDEVVVNDGRQIGTVVGFDISHEPNHFNVVIGASTRATGRAFALGLGDRVVFSSSPSWR